MTLDLLRRDPSVQALPKWLLISPLVASVLEGVRTMIFGMRVWQSGPAETAPPGDLLFLIFILWLPVSMFLLLGRTGQRCTTFDLGMPLSARRLWSAHLAAVTLASLAVLFATTLVVRLRDALVAAMFHEVVVPPSNLLGLTLPLVVTLVLGVVLLQRRDRSLHTTSTRRGNAALAVATVVALYGLVAALAWLPPAVSLVPLVVAIILVVSFRRSLPAAFAVVPLEPHDGRAAAVATGEGTWARHASRGGFKERLGRNLAIVHILSRGVAPGQLIEIPALLVFGYPFILAWGVLVSGVAFSEDFRYWMLVLTAYLLYAFLPAPMAQLFALDPLPISRRRLFAFTVLPVILLLSLGYGAGWTAGRLTLEPSPRVRFQEAAFENLAPPYPFEPAMVRVPVEHFRIAWDGQPPENGSPWGESHPAWTVPLFNGSTAVLYSPFSTPEGSSAEFVALQISRAVEAIYGRSIPPSEIMSRYLAVDDRGVVVATKAGGLTLLNDYPDLVTPREVSAFPVFMLFTTVLYLLTSSLYMRSYRVTVSDRRRLVIFFAFTGGLFVMHLMLTAMLITRVIRALAFSGLLTIFTSKVTDALPGGTLTLWIVCALLAWAAYRLAESEFERVEAAVPRGKADA